MTMLDPVKRSARGVAMTEAILGKVPREAATLYEASWRDFVFAEIWSREGLDRRSRYLIAMTSAANNGDAAMAGAYARGALMCGALTLAELREAAAHAAIYCGWGTGAIIDAGVSAAADELGLAAADSPPIRGAGWTHDARMQDGMAAFLDVMTFAGPPAHTAYFEAGINGYVFGEIWQRPGLDQRARRWITLVGVCDSAAYTPIHTHIYAAMQSGNTDQAEMFEFVLHYAVHSGWPRASVAQGAVIEQGAQVAKGLAFGVKADGQ